MPVSPTAIVSDQETYIIPKTYNERGTSAEICPRVCPFLMYVLQMGEPVQVNQRGYSSKAYNWVLR